MLEEHQLHSQSKSMNSHDHLLRNMLLRLDKLEQHKMKPYITSIESNSEALSYDKIRQLLKMVSNNGLQNLKRLQDKMKMNWQVLSHKVIGIEDKILTALKEKEDVMDDFEMRIRHMQNSSGLVNELMRKFSDRQDDKYSRMGLVEQKIKDIENVVNFRQISFNNKIKLQQEDLKAFVLNKNKEIQGRVNQRYPNQQKRNSNDGQSNIGEIDKRVRELQKRSKNDEFCDFQEIKDKVRIVQIQLRENKRKWVKIQEQVQNTIVQIQQMRTGQRQVKYNTQSKVLGVQKKNNLFEQQQRKQNYQTDNRNDNKLKIYESQDYLKSNQLGMNRQRKIKEQSDEDPFSQQIVGGIRGLLKKSKEKDQKTQNSKSKSKDPLPPPKNLLSQRGHTSLNRLSSQLPEVKGQIKKKSYDTSYANSDVYVEDEGDEGNEYNIDEDGYLIDEQGNYYMDEDGNRVQISEQQMQEMMEEQNY